MPTPAPDCRGTPARGAMSAALERQFSQFWPRFGPNSTMLADFWPGLTNIDQFGPSLVKLWPTSALFANLGKVCPKLGRISAAGAAFREHSTPFGHLFGRLSPKLANSAQLCPKFAQSWPWSCGPSCGHTLARRFWRMLINLEQLRRLWAGIGQILANSAQLGLILADFRQDLARLWAKHRGPGHGPVSPAGLPCVPAS